MTRSSDLQSSHAGFPHIDVKQTRKSWFRTLFVVTSMLCVASGFACRSMPEEVPADVDPQTLRNPGAGPVVGFTTEDDAHAWRGIPFAKAPAGELRWRAPLPAEKWTEVREAVSYGASCIQFAGPAGGRDGAKRGEKTGSEDCLFLNIYAPKFVSDGVPRGDARLPVMYWIHGGGNTVGDATVYDASTLALQENVIVVTVHYRMGVLGWLSHPALRTRGTSALDASGNYGTLDLVRGLRWVSENIGAFGGDPSRVTIFGESAGGRNVFSLLLTPQAAGLFHGAIAQSGSATTAPRSSAENFVDDAEPGHKSSSNEAFLKILIADGRASDREEAKAALASMSDVALAEYLRGLTPEQLLAGYGGGELGGMYRIEQIIRDGAVIPEEPAIEALRLGKYNQVPSIMGTNRDELRLFSMFSSSHVAKLFGLPLWMKDAERYKASADHPTRMWKIRGVDAPAKAMREVQGPSVYGYRFDWDEEPRVGFIDMSEALGAAHAIEIPFVFGWLTLGPGTRFVFDDDKQESNRQLSERMMSYWAEFAYSGDPGRGRNGDLPLWKSWSPAAQSGEKFIVFDSEADGGVRMSDESPLTRDGVIKGIAADSRLIDHKRDRCDIYYSLASRTDSMTPEEYDEVEGGACAEDFPFADYPWKG